MNVKSMLSAGLSGICLWLIPAHVIAQGLLTPVGAYPANFTYFNPAEPNMPQGSPSAAKSIVMLDFLDDENFESDDEEEGGSSAADDSRNGSSFLIRTFRDDDTLCLCMAGHEMAAILKPQVPALGDFDADLEIYMNYLGRDSIVNIQGTDYHFNHTTGFEEGYFTGGRLVGYYNERVGSTFKDIALVLIDKRQLPLVQYSTLGYSFDSIDTADLFYTLSHPFVYPMRLQDNIQAIQQGDTWVMVASQWPYGTGPGASGSPLIKKGPAGSPYLYSQGVVSTGSPEVILNDPEPAYNSMSVGRVVTYTKISLLESAIKQHCWKNKTATEILAGGLHKQTIQVDNNANITPFTQNQTISSAAGIASSSGAYGDPPTKKIRTSYLKANNCTIAGFTLPANYPSTTDPWRVSIVAKKIEVNGTFEYTASNNAELNLAAVVISSTGQTVVSTKNGNLLADVKQGTAPEINVYPNPSYNGIFNLVFAQTGNYMVRVYSTDGRDVYSKQSNDAGTHTFDLSELPHGTYALSVSDVLSGKQLYHQMLVY